MSRTPEGWQIVTYPIAEGIHQIGVKRASQSSSYGEALSYFDSADISLALEAQEAAAASGDLLGDEPSVLLQRARIDRDRQFTLARIGMRDSIPASITGAYVRIADEADNHDRAARRLEADYFTPESWRYLQSEIGASVGLMGRLVTVSLVVSGEEGLPESQAKEYYEDADERTAGNNDYYAASNAMNAARHERVFGSNKEALAWLRRANEHRVHAAKYDRPNAKAALRTVVARTATLRTTHSARKAVLRRP